MDADKKLGSEPAERANREVERALREEVEAGWTQDDVTDLVEDVLEEWDDD